MRSAGTPVATNRQPWSVITFIAALLAITVLALIPGDAVDLGVSVWDKAQHAVAYGVLALLGSIAWPSRLVYVATGLALHGGIIELAQHSLTTTRLGDWQDWLADCIGIGSVLAIRALGQRAG